MRISDWSSDVCSSDLRPLAVRAGRIMAHFMAHSNILPPLDHSPESHASAWPVSAWDGRRQLRSNAEWFLPADACAQGDTDRKSVVSGKSVSVRLAIGGSRIIKKTKPKEPKNKA